MEQMASMTRLNAERSGMVAVLMSNQVLVEGGMAAALLVMPVPAIILLGVVRPGRPQR